MVRYKVWKRIVSENKEDKCISHLYFFWTNMFLLLLFSKKRDIEKSLYGAKDDDFVFCYVGFDVLM